MNSPLNYEEFCRRDRIELLEHQHYRFAIQRKRLTRSITNLLSFIEFNELDVIEKSLVEQAWSLVDQLWDAEMAIQKELKN